MKWLAKLFWLDDRTGLRSTSKLTLCLTVLVSLSFVISCTMIVFFNWIVLTPEDIQVLNLVKEFLIFFVPTIVGGYNFNRHTKLKNGSAELLTPEKEVEEIPQG